MPRTTAEKLPRAFDPLDPDLTLAEAAQLLGCSVSLLSKRLPQGRCPFLEPYKGFNKRWRIPRAAIERYHAQQREQAYGRALPAFGRKPRKGPAA